MTIRRFERIEHTDVIRVYGSDVNELLTAAAEVATVSGATWTVKDDAVEFTLPGMTSEVG